MEHHHLSGENQPFLWAVWGYFLWKMDDKNGLFLDDNSDDWKMRGLWFFLWQTGNFFRSPQHLRISVLNIQRAHSCSGWRLRLTMEMFTGNHSRFPMKIEMGIGLWIAMFDYQSLFTYIYNTIRQIYVIYYNIVKLCRDAVALRSVSPIINHP